MRASGVRRSWETFDTKSDFMRTNSISLRTLRYTTQTPERSTASRTTSMTRSRETRDRATCCIVSPLSLIPTSRSGKSQSCRRCSGSAPGPSSLANTRSPFDVLNTEMTNSPPAASRIRSPRTSRTNLSWCSLIPARAGTPRRSRMTKRRTTPPPRPEESGNVRGSIFR